jgi:hypothetical protein
MSFGFFVVLPFSSCRMRANVPEASFTVIEGKPSTHYIHRNDSSKFPLVCQRLFQLLSPEFFSNFCCLSYLCSFTTPLSSLHPFLSFSLPLSYLCPSFFCFGFLYLQARTVAAFKDEPYGCGGELLLKKLRRDPFAVGPPHAPSR